MAKINLSPVEKPNKLVAYCKKEWRVLVLASLAGILFNACLSLIAILQGRLLDTLVYSKPLEVLLLEGSIFLGAVFGIQLMRYFKRYYVRVFANRTSSTMRRILYNNIMSLDFQMLSKESTGDLMNKAVGDVDICVEGIRKVINEIFDTGVFMISYLSIMLFYDVKITLIAIIFIPLAIFIAQRLKVIIVKYTRRARGQSSRVADLTYSNIDHIVLYRINGLIAFKNEEYREQLSDLEQKTIKANVLDNSMQPIYKALSMLGIVGIIYFGGQRVLDGAWTVGVFTAYITIFTALAVKASRAARLFNTVQKAGVSWNRIKPYLGGYNNWGKKEIDEAKEICLEVKGLNFTYPKLLQKIILDANFEAKNGQIIGITGAVASGKSSLGLALTGIYPYEGSIRLNNKELCSYTQAQKSELISYMGHKPQLLSDTIYENITLGEDGDINGVLEDVCFLEDLKFMPEGIHTLVGNNGVRLSGGQQARISLARALYHKGRVLILDDPFSAVDMNTEQKIIANLTKNYKDRLFLIISHRLSIFPKTDKVIFIDSHKKIHCKAHEDLLEDSLEYRELYLRQSGGETNGE